MIQELFSNWHILTPDINGSYINGTWSLAASPRACLDTRTGISETYAPLYAASAVLPDGRVIVIGGEYNNFALVDTNLGEIYDPVANNWTCLAAPSGWIQVGDAMSVVLPNGKFQLGNFAVTANFMFNQIATLDLSSAVPTWTVVNPTGKSGDANGLSTGGNNEEGWTLLPNGNVLTLEVWSSADTTSTPALSYSPVTHAWSSAGTAPDPLVLINKGNSSYFEVGPSLLRPDGTVFAAGATGFNDIYDTNTGLWSKGPPFPSQPLSGGCSQGTVTEQFAVVDGPAALEPNGNVLVEASPVDNTCGWIPPAEFFEWDGTNLTQVAATPDSATSVSVSFDGRLLPLPNGQILFTDTSTDVEIYSPTNGIPYAGSAPTITSSPTTAGIGATGLPISGTQFNGLSAAVAYGDDYQAATNYPLVQITNLNTHHVFYARTHGHSTMGVATGSLIVSTLFDVPTNIESGPSTLVVVANGIPSSSVPINIIQSIVPTTDATLGSSPNPSANGQQVTFTATVIGLGGTPTGSVSFFDGNILLGTSALDGSGVATFPTSTLAVGFHSIAMEYLGDSTFGPAQFAPITQVVGTATGVVMTIPSAVAYLQTVTLSATVSGSGGPPTGTVTFLDANSSLDGATSLGTVTLTAGAANLTVTSSSTPVLTPGPHSITAQYNGDAVFAPATSTLNTEVVRPIATTTVVTSPLNPGTVGQLVTLVATVSGTQLFSINPTGTVLFFDGGVALGIGAPNSGRWSFTTASLSLGPHSITASYAGDTNFAPGLSATPLVQVVGNATQTTGLTSSLNPSIVGQPVTLTATISAASGTPTGSVSFLDGATSLGTPVTLDGSGRATLTGGSFSAAGSHSITARYNGDANFGISTSAAVSQTVNTAGFAAVTTAPSVAAGQSGQINLTLYAASGSNLTFTLSCLGAPAKFNCAFSPNPVTPGPFPNGTTVQLTYSTSSSILPGLPSNRSPWPWATLAVLGALLGLLSACMATSQQSPRRRLAFGSGLAVVAIAVALIGCGSSGGASASSTTPPYTGTPKGAATFTVSGTSGATTISTPVTVTVQ